MDLPVIPTPIFPRWLWMEEVTFSHIPIAAIITSYMFLAPILEWIGYHRKDLRFDRLSKSLVYFSLILFSPGAALGTGIPFFIMGLYPEFWARWVNIFFWPLILQFIFFLLEVFFLFFLYYLPWDRMMHRKRVHIAFGFIATMFGELIQLVWDAIGSYMMTPSAPFPMVDNPVGFSATGFFNPSFPFLFLHRTFGNLSWTMLIVGAIFAVRSLRARVPRERAYFTWGADLTFTMGFLFFFAQPFIGWFYSRVLQTHAPVAFHAVMGGFAWYYFVPKMALIVLMVLISGTYVFIRHRDKFWLLAAVTGGLAAFYILFYLHPPLSWFGGPGAWRAAYTTAFVLFIAYLWLMRWKGHLLHLRGWQSFLLVGALASILVFALGGNIRERAKSPQTVYGELEKPEATDYERNRFLAYQNCVQCHHLSPRDLVLPEGESWAERVSIERRRSGVEISDEAAARIVSYLEEAKP
jgi:cytochrome bd-type quinol oxidase subunit 1